MRPTLEGEPVDVAAVVREHEATVLVFWSADCPCVRRYQARTQALADGSDPSRVAVLLVASNAGEDAEHMRATARERGVKLPILRDERGVLAQTLGARTTPTAVVLDRAGVVVYRGWIDNEREPGEPDRNAYVEQAVAGVLRHEQAFAAASPIFGCMITRALGDEDELATAPTSAPSEQTNSAPASCSTCGCGAQHE